MPGRTAIAVCGSSHPTRDRTLAGQYLTVVLENEASGIAVLKVGEIIRLQNITPEPRMPACVTGVINLRGRVSPIIDLRVKFGVKAGSAARTCIVVVPVKLPVGQIVHLGRIVGRVEAVATLAANAIEPTPDFGARVRAGSLLARAKVQGAAKTRRDIAGVFARDPVTALAQAI